MTKIPLVSVIVPVYQAEKTIKKCVTSILEQTYLAIEIILVNDGSTDSSYQICQEMEAMHNNIKIVNQENRGPAGARNTGIRMAEGQFIVFVDADDWIGKELIEKLVDNQQGVDFVVSGICLVFENKYKLVNITSFNNNRIIDADAFLRQFIYSKSCVIPTGPVAKLYRRDVIISNNVFFDENYSQGEDYLFNIQYLNYINSIAVLGSTTMYYVNNNRNSLTRSYRTEWWKTKQLSYFESLRILKDHNKEKCYIDELCARQIVYAIGTYTNEACKNDYKKSKKKLREVSHSEEYKKYYIRGKKLLSKRNRVFAILIYYKIDIVAYLIARFYVKYINKRVQ